MTVSKALEKSVKMTSTWYPFTKASLIYCVKTNKLVAVDLEFLNPCCSLIIFELRVGIICLETSSSNSLGIKESKEIGR